MEEKAARLGLSGRAVFAGAVNGAAEYMQAMDAFLFPSLFEGLGIALIEAQCSGLKCFCSNAVPKEANVSALLEYIPIKFPARERAQRVLAGSAEIHRRKGRQEEVRAAGYEIRAAAKWLEELYISLP